MIINSSKVKSEALLLFCRELINSYQNSDDKLFNISDDTIKFIDLQIKQLLKAINVTIQPNDYYERNYKTIRISIILRTYEYIKKIISKKLNQGDKFNPSMLCFALLSTWFVELEKEQNNKEFLYFCLYPYSDLYDKLLLDISELEYKKLNISMILLAEDIIIKLNNYRFK